MEASEVGTKAGIGGFLSKVLGAGVKETVDSIGNAIDKIDKSDEKLELQLKYKELLLNMEGACIDYETKLLENKTKIIESETKGGKLASEKLATCTYVHLHVYCLQQLCAGAVLQLTSNNIG
ncbi:MAG: hypothetical protein IPK96_16380 [Flammeovirgaceae bacterium]|nr:hypothetical protein [Flammeovirgaceae bacterium]